MRRRETLATGETYHIFNRSIADFVIFNNRDEFIRMLQLIEYYRIENELKFSDFLELEIVQKKGFYQAIKSFSKNEEELVQFIAYCLMPTHVHFVLKQVSKNGISQFIGKICNSYTRYFNTVHKRKGPLWESRFKNVLVDDDTQLLHLTRYVHLNPVTISLVKRAEDWQFSSYNEYILKEKAIDINKICQFEDLLEIKPLLYRKFVNDRVSYQKELAKIKQLLIEQ